ncbi:hypothetical protein HK104_000074 [Borealophlyctis nickersoniae]|nr:hypothetical protein HK104_000074 [Borealophlyctis nickersoniae]
MKAEQPCGQSFHADNSPPQQNLPQGGRDLSLHIAHLCTRKPATLASRRLIDLGSGTGIVALTAAHFGATVDLTDIAPVIAGENLRHNLDVNGPETTGIGGPIRLATLEWNERDLSDFAPPYDYVTGADVLYSMAAADPLAHTIDALADEKTVVWIAHERRDPLVHERFLEIMKELGFKGTKVSRRAAGKAGAASDSLVEIWKFRKVNSNKGDGS